MLIGEFSVGIGNCFSCEKLTFQNKGEVTLQDLPHTLEKHGFLKNHNLEK